MVSEPCSHAYRRELTESFENGETATLLECHQCGMISMLGIHTEFWWPAPSGPPTVEYGRALWRVWARARDLERRTMAAMTGSQGW